MEACTKRMQHEVMQQSVQSRASKRIRLRCKTNPGSAYTGSRGNEVSDDIHARSGTVGVDTLGASVQTVAVQAPEDRFAALLERVRRRELAASIAKRQRCTGSLDGVADISNSLGVNSSVDRPLGDSKTSGVTGSDIQCGAPTAAQPFMKG